MRSRMFLFSAAAAAFLGAVSAAQATIVIKTNDGGADAEVRESQGAADLLGNVTGTNRGDNGELATRANDNDPTASNDRSSVMYIKFDISSLPGAGDSFWDDKEVLFQGHVRNDNLPENRLLNRPNPVPGQGVRLHFDVRALNPNGTYIEDDPGQNARTDRAGNDYTNDEYKYNWDEDAITFYNAPGIQPHCMSSGNCGGVDANSIFQTLGQYDDFDGNAVELGDWEWQLPTPANHLPVGAPLRTNDEGLKDNLKQLVLDAKDAGRDHITLMVHHGLDPTTEANGGTTPGSFLNHNYLMIPKEQLDGNHSGGNDINYDPDGSGPLEATGSPWSCADDDICPGSTVYDNSLGDFSPKLIVRVPEPASVALVALGSLAALGLVQRRRK